MELTGMEIDKATQSHQTKMKSKRQEDETSALMKSSPGLLESGHDDSSTSSTAKQTPRVRTTFEWTLGIIFILIVALIWTFSSVLVQYIFHNLSFQGPFFLTYVGISLFSINLPLWYLSQVVWPKLQRNWRYMWPLSCLCDGSRRCRDDSLLSTSGSEGTKKKKKLAPLRKIIRISAIISPLWFIANYTYNISLNMTTVTSSTIISSTSTVFTFLLSLCVLRERFGWLKVVGVLLCVAGNISTIFKDSTSHGVTPTPTSTAANATLMATVGKDKMPSWNYVVGDLTALFAAFMYGVYTTAICRLMPDHSDEDEEEVSVSLFFGFVGVINFVILLPFVVVLHVAKIESLKMLTKDIIGLMLLRGIFDNVLSDYLWARAMLLTSPTVATVGLSLTVPFAIISDYICHGMTPSFVTLVASALVLGGFYFINVSTRQNNKPLDQDTDYRESK